MVKTMRWIYNDNVADDNDDVADDNVDDSVDHLHPLHPGLSLQIGVKLLLNVSQNWSPAAPE